MPPPLLWHLPISHFSEKVRWAFDWKRIPHRRRVMPPGLHPLGGLVLSRGQVYTMPVVVADDRRIVDSTDIIAWLEQRFPSAAPLYPADPEQRARALELEDWFDENLGPSARQWGFNALLTEPEAVRSFALKQTEWVPFDVPVAAFAPFAKTFLALRYSTADEAGVAAARQKLLAALDRLEAELDGRDYLVGDRFSVADLTAAALFYPLVVPEEGPWQPVRTQAFLEFQDSVRERPAFRWVEETFRRHRRVACN
jgi:glutathione S-transferase